VLTGTLTANFASGSTGTLRGSLSNASSVVLTRTVELDGPGQRRGTGAEEATAHHAARRDGFVPIRCATPSPSIY
jgi:hypothetical protein